MRIKINHLLFLLFFIITAHSCLKKSDESTLKIADPDKLDKLLDYYVEIGFYPFIYARLEDLDGKVIYEHSTVNNDLLPDTKVDGQTLT